MMIFFSAVSVFPPKGMRWNTPASTPFMGEGHPCKGNHWECCYILTLEWGPPHRHKRIYWNQRQRDMVKRARVVLKCSQCFIKKKQKQVTKPFQQFISPSLSLSHTHKIGNIHAKINNGGKLYVTFILYIFLYVVLIFLNEFLCNKIKIFTAVKHVGCNGHTVPALLLTSYETLGN